MNKGRGERRRSTWNWATTIRVLRAGAGLSAKDLARKARCSAPMISLIERGLRAPSEDLTERLAQALGCSVDLIYTLASPAPFRRALLPELLHHIRP